MREIGICFWKMRQNESQAQTLLEQKNGLTFLIVILEVINFYYNHNNECYSSLLVLLIFIILFS